MICLENARLSSLVVVVSLAETQATHGSACFKQAWSARSARPILSVNRDADLVTLSEKVPFVQLMIKINR